MTTQATERKCRGLFGLASVVLSVSLLFSLGTPPAAGEEPNVSEIAGESGYRTVVERKTEGKLSSDDFRQITTLASRIVLHVNNASRYLLDEHTKDAEQQLHKALTLVGIIRDILPVTTIKTNVKDKHGKTVYEYENQVQDELIPIYKEMVTVEVVQPIIDAKSEEAALQGMRLSDAQLLHTSVLLDLGYIERRIKRTLELLDKPDEALEQIVLAQTAGIRLNYYEEDTPLVKAQSALRLAERMIQDGKIEIAEENLRLAQVHLETYRTLVGQDETGPVRKLQEQITELSKDASVKGGVDKVRSFWDRVTGWLHKETGEVEQTTEKTEEKKQAG